jgi:hypothetical protein
MSDSYPAALTIEIDRKRLRRYLCTKAFLGWFSPAAVIGGLLGFGSISKSLDKGNFSFGEVLALIVQSTAVGVLVAVVVVLPFFFLFGYRVASRLASTLDVSVEGPFLRIRQHAAALSDRKLHFRSIVDYATIQDSLMRFFGIEALQMPTTGCGVGSTVTIHGIKDCLKIRDVLSEIDRQRENQ